MAKTAYNGFESSTTEGDSSGSATSSASMGSSNDSNNFSVHLTTHRLNGKNYLEWAQSVKLAVDGRGKLGYLTGEKEKPRSEYPKMSTWKSENSMVTSWLLNSMESSIGKPYLFLPTAKDVWEAVRETYSDVENASQIFELKNTLWKSRQGEKEVTIYYNEMVSLWQELDQCYNDEWECTGDSVKAKKKEESDRVYLFLAGLNKEFDEVRSRILGKSPLPTLRNKEKGNAQN